MLREGTDSTTKKYVRANGRYIARVDSVNGGTAQVSYYHTDQLGSTRAVSGANSATMKYEAYGKLIESAGAIGSHKNRFTGKPIDSTGLYYYGARFYDPEIGRFISVDPIRDGLNWYVYASNNPLRYVDPTGLADEDRSGMDDEDENKPEAWCAWDEKPAEYGGCEKDEERAAGMAALLGSKIGLKSSGNSSAASQGKGSRVETNAIRTPYGNAVQSNSSQAYRLRTYVDKGGTLYRGGAFGKQNVADAQFWAPESPTTSGYANKYGTPFESYNWIVGGKMTPGSSYITRPAPGLGNNQGGGFEVVTVPFSVKIYFFFMP